MVCGSSPAFGIYKMLKNAGASLSITFVLEVIF